MKYYSFILLLSSTAFILSCSNCSDNKNKPTVSDKDSTNITERIDTVDSVARKDSVSVNVYEVVEEELSDSVNGNKAPEVRISKRGEKTVQKINDDFSLQGNGIGIVRIGADISKLPSAYKGLYDKKAIEGGELLFYNGKDLILEVSFNKKNKQISSIRVTSPNIKTEDGICQFMDFNSLMKNEKAKKAIGKKNKYNLESFNIDGITYEMEENIEGDKYVSAIIIK